MDRDRRIPKDGTLEWVDSDPELYKHNNIMIIEVPENMRSPSEPFFQLATIDRSIPGNDFDGNRILDMLIPGLPKVTLFEEPEVKEDSPSPPPKKYVPRQEHINSWRASSYAGRSRPPHYKKPWVERSRPNPDEISPWVPGNEPYIPHGNIHIPKIPLSVESGPRNVVEYHDRTLNDNFVHMHPLPQEYPNPGSFGDGPPPNYSGGFGDGPPPNYSGGFGDGPPPNYSGGFSDGPPPSSIHGHHPTNFRSHNSNQNYERNRFRKNNFQKRSPRARRGAFQNGRSTVAKQKDRFHSNVQQTSPRNKARRENYNANKQRGVNRNPRGKFNRRRPNYR